MVIDGLHQLPIAGVERRPAAEHYQIQIPERPAMLAEPFPNQALDSIPVYRTGGAFLGDRQTQARPLPAVPASKDGEKPIRRSAGIGKHPPKLSRCGQAGLSGKSSIQKNRDLRGCAQGVNRVRPLARRALSTFRPLRVDMRARKPWVRARLRRLG